MLRASALAILLAAGALAISAQAAPPQEPTPAPAPAPAPRPHPRPAVRAHYAEDSAASRRAYLGVEINAISPSRAAELKLKDARGVEVNYVDRDGPAGKAGLRDHDVIQSFDGKTVDDADDLRRYLRDSAPGKTVALGIVRNGQPMTVKTTLASHDWMAYGGEDMHIVIPRMNITVPRIPEIPAFVMMQSWRRSGIQVENLNTQLGEFFGVKNGEGVLVRSVDKGSRAEQAGLKAGDVIVRVGNNRIAGTDDFMRSLRDARGGTVQLGVVRDRREQSLSLALPPAGTDGSELHDMEINIPAEEWSDNMQQWAREFRKDMQRNAREWRKAWEAQQKQWHEQMRDWDKDKDNDRQ